LYKTVLQINVSLNSGSTGRIAEDIGKLLIEVGYTSYVAYGRDITKSISIPIKIGSSSEIYYHVIQTRLFDIHGFGSKKGTREFIYKIIKLNPDIIHLHNIHGYYLNYPLLFNFLRSFGKPVIWTLHDCWPITGHCSFFSAIKCEKWKSGCFKCPLKHDYPKSLLIDNSINNYRLKKEAFTGIENLTITTVSSWLASTVKESFLGTYPIEVIHNGVDTTIFSPHDGKDIRKKYNVGNKFMILGVASFWGERKGLYDFHKLSKMIRADSVIVLVGLKEQQIIELPEGIIGISKTENQSELAKLYSAADVFVNPSRAETFGMVTAEAMACGTPVIAYNNTASPEIIGIKEGILVEDGNIVAMFESINRIKNNGKASYSENCRNKALTYFDKSKNYSKYITLYDRLLAKP
jgi:glycosyltransferase involved in cell wall biosynthesis